MKAYEEFTKLEDSEVEIVTETKTKEELLSETISSNPEYLKRRGTMSNCIRVIKTYGFGKNDNIILDKEKTERIGKRSFFKTSKIVGYLIENVGTDTIEYRTEHYKKNEDGVYVGEKVTLTLKPGERSQLTRKYLNLLGCIPENSFKLENGRLIRSSAGGDKKKRDVTNIDFEEELEAYYFAFYDKKKKVNSDEIKINISEKINVNGEERYIVKDKYVETFGYLNNELKKPTKKNTEIDNRDVNANFVYKLAQKSGVL